MLAVDFTHPMTRRSVLICFAVLLCASLWGGRALLQRMERDARELRLCRTARSLAAEYSSFREHVSRVPADTIVRKLMDAELFLPRAAALGGLLDALKSEAPDRFPRQPGFAAADPTLDSAQLAQEMQHWKSEVERRYRCPELLVPEKYVVKFVPTQPRVRPAEPPLEQLFAAALARNAQIAAQYRGLARQDSRVLCRSRDSLAKARVIHDYLHKRCAGAERQMKSVLNCALPMRRSQEHIDGLERLVRLNETKYEEKWGQWLGSSDVYCVGLGG